MRLEEAVTASSSSTAMEQIQATEQMQARKMQLESGNNVISNHGRMESNGSGIRRMSLDHAVPVQEEGSTSSAPQSLTMLKVHHPSHVIKSSRLATSTVFYDRSPVSPYSFYWTIFPRRTVKMSISHDKNGLLLYANRIHSVNRLLEQAGYRHNENQRDEIHDLVHCPALGGAEREREEYRTGVIFTDRPYAADMMQEVVTYWTEKDHERTKRVYFVDVDALHDLSTYVCPSGLGPAGMSIEAMIDPMYRICVI